MTSKFDQFNARREARLFARNFARGPCPRCGGTVRRGVALRRSSDGKRGAGHVCAAADCPWALFFEVGKQYGGGWSVVAIGSSYFATARELLPADGVPLIAAEGVRA